jgi:superfamily I DNA and RNA helicase
VVVDALLVSRAHGIVAFLLAGGVPHTQEAWGECIDDQDRLYAVLESYLGRHEELRTGRRLGFTLETATVFPASIQGLPSGADGEFLALDDVAAWVSNLPEISEAIERGLNAAIQRVTTIKPVKKRALVKKSTSRGAVIKEIERNIANLDEWQKSAAIETPEGPQRIRGLAGSGKTVVLALKAAYLHSQHPEWNIAVTFHTRALYQQFNDLVTRFSFEYSNDTFDADHLQILHTWGSRSSAGVYSEMARMLGTTARDWGYARGTYGYDGAFQGICRELLSVARETQIDPVYDAVLIDEAQDLPPEFFQLVYQFIKGPKRVIWAFDELQKLSEDAMPDTDTLFGVGPSGENLISLESGKDEPQRDIILPVCYRNTPWALATAHALGIGVYRHGGLVQHFDTPKLWKDIGYNVLTGRLALGANVSLQRSDTSYPSYFPELLNPEDAVVLRSFDDQLAQDTWVAGQIKANLEEDELDPDDILIVLPDTLRAKKRAPALMRALHEHGVSSHLVGVNNSRDEVFIRDSVALAHIHRAKGNEAPMVYVVDAQYATGRFDVVSRRNTLFTAITRSRAWVRIVGSGDAMKVIAEEVKTVRDKEFKLNFKIPTSSELAKMRSIHRDRSDAEISNLKKVTRGLQAFIEAYENQEIDLYDIPPELRSRLVTRLLEDLPNGDD